MNEEIIYRAAMMMLTAVVAEMMPRRMMLMLMVGDSMQMPLHDVTLAQLDKTEYGMQF